MGAATSTVGIALSIEEKEQFQADIKSALSAFEQLGGFEKLTKATEKAFSGVTETVKKAGAATKAITEKSVDDIVAAQKRADNLLVEASKKNLDRRTDLQKQSTNQVLTQLEMERQKKEDLLLAMEGDIDKSDKATLAKRKKTVEQELRLLNDEARAREEVISQGAGAKLGLPGLFRNVLIGGGEYKTLITKFEAEKKELLAKEEEQEKRYQASVTKEHEAATNARIALEKKEAAEAAIAEEKIKQAVAKEAADEIELAKSVVREREAAEKAKSAAAAAFEAAEFQRLEKMEQAEAKAAQQSIKIHKQKIDAEIAETKELNEKSAEKSEGGLAGKFGISGGAMAGIAGVGGLTAALGGLFEKGLQVNESLEKTTIALRGQGQSEEEAKKHADEFASSANKVAIALGKTHQEINEGTQAYIRYGGKSKDIAKTQEDVAALAQKAGIDMTAAGKAMAGALDPEIEKSLKRQGIVFTENATPEEKAIELHEKLKGTVEGMKDAADGPVGAFGKFKEVMSQLLETGGAVVFNFLTPLISVVGAVASKVAGLIGPIAALTKEGGFLSGIVKVLSFVIGGAVLAFGAYSAAMIVNTFLHGESAVAVGITTATKNLMNGTLLESAVAWLTETVPMGISTAVSWLHVAATTALGVAMVILTSPITLVIAGVALLIAGVIYAYKHFTWFHNAVVAVGNFLKNVLWPIIVEGIEFWAKWLNPIGLAIEGFKALYEKVEFFRNVVDATVMVVKEAAKWLGNLFSSEEKLTDAEVKAKEALDEKNKKIREQNELLRAATKAQEDYYGSLKKTNDEVRQGADDLGAKQKELREALARNVRAYANGAGTISKEAFENARDGIIAAYKVAQRGLNDFNSGEETADKLLGIGEKDKPRVAKSAKAIAKTFSEQVQAFLADEKNEVTLGVKMGGHSQEDSLAAIKAKLHSAAALQGEASAKLIQAENANYAKSVQLAGDNQAKLEVLAKTHQKRLAEIEAKGGADRIKGTAELSRAAYDIERKIEDDKYKSTETDIKKRQADGLISKDRAMKETEVAQHEHYVRLIAIQTQYNIDASESQLQLSQNEQKKREEEFKASEDRLKSGLDTKLNTLQAYHEKERTSQRAFAASEYEAIKSDLQNMLILTIEAFGAESRETLAAQDALSKLNRSRRGVLEKERDEDRKQLDKLRVEETTNELDKQLLIEASKYTDDMLKYSDNEEMKTEITAVHLKKRGDIAGKYWVDQNQYTKAGFDAFNKASADGMTWLTGRTAIMMNEQHTYAAKVAQDMINTGAQWVGAAIKQYEQKAIAYLFNLGEENVASTANTAIVATGEATKTTAVIGTGIATATAGAQTKASLLSTAATAVGSAATFIGANLAIAASSIATAVAAAAAWLAALGPLGWLAIAGMATAVIVEWGNIKKVLGFKSGGFTGSGDSDDAAGVVHKNEYVFDAAATQRIGVHNLENIRRGGGGGGGHDLSAHTEAVVAAIQRIPRTTNTIMDQRKNLLSQEQEKNNMNSSTW
jgi:hypothetical protein